MSFLDYLEELPLAPILSAAQNASGTEVERALSADQLDLFDFAALLSPEADSRLERMARRSQDITSRRFGRTIQLFAPLYLSNECVETCTYCSFARPNTIERRTLHAEEVDAEAEILAAQGFRHLLLVSGEHPRKVSPSYVENIIRRLAPRFPSLSVEVQPQSEEIYRAWVRAGCDGLVVYQETYDREAYSQVHLGREKAGL